MLIFAKDISQRDFQQVIIRGDGKDQFNQIITDINNQRKDLNYFYQI